MSVSCQTCNMEWINVPTDIVEEDLVLSEPPRTSRRWSRLTRQAWISRPLNRKVVDDSASVATIPNSLGLDFSGSPTRHRRRPSSILSDSSEQTRVEHAPPLRSILSGASSISSKGSTLAAKRSVKFSEENVVHDYAYSDPCEHGDKYSYEFDYGYDCEGFYDMFSFEETASIPAEHRWGIISRFICWLRRARARCRGETATFANGGLSISRPLPLGPPTVAALKIKQEKANKKGRSSVQTVLKRLACTG